MQMSLRRIRAGTRGLLLVLAAACGGAHHGSSDLDQPAGPDLVHVRVENSAFVDMRVHVLVNGSNHLRLGTVGALTTRTLRVPAALASSRSMRLLAVPMAAGEPHQTEVIRVQPGDTVVWQLNNEARVSSF